LPTSAVIAKAGTLGTCVVIHTGDNGIISPMTCPRR